MRMLELTSFSALIALTVFTRGCYADGDGLYLTNGKEIFFNSDPKNAQSPPVSVYKTDYGRIVGLACDLDSQLLFWSDVSIVQRGIYQATILQNGSLGAIRAIVSNDIVEVNGLSVDWISKNLYWTDGRKRTIEVIGYKSNQLPLPRRVIVMDGLFAPRGIYADPISRYLFWNDQGFGNIERSLLDGSGRTEIRPRSNATWPNQMVVYNNTLYWVESFNKTLQSSSLTGQNWRTVVTLAGITEGNNVFGLAIKQDHCYITSWSLNQVITLNLVRGSLEVATRVLGTDVVFSVAFYSSTVQPSVDLTTRCLTFGCSHLCFQSSLQPRCSCPSFGGWVLNGKDCRKMNATDNVLLYAAADGGYVGYTQLTKQGQQQMTSERYLIGRSLRPVAVAYDSTEQIVYWSDVSERTIHKVKIDGTNPTIFLNGAQGLGVVDGMAIDPQLRKLYYTHIGSVSLHGVDYSWHKIEMVELDSPYKRRTIVDTADKPRALALDSAAGFLYYTDWGDRARIVRTNLDGSHPLELRTGLNNPNGLAILGRRLYVTESNFKTRNASNSPDQYPGSGQIGTLYSMNLDGSGWKDELSDSNSYKLLTPFGLSHNNDDTLFISDWDKNVIISLKVNTETNHQVIHDNVDSPMMLLYSAFSQQRGNSPCTARCSDICLKTPSSSVCSCDSYSTRALVTDTLCNAKSESFIAIGDMNSLKFYSLDGSDHSVYTAVQGQPYYSNIVSVAYDSVTDTLYYSDLNSKFIMSLTLGRNDSTEFFRVNHIIDGMTIDVQRRRLYWSDAINGQIVYVPLLNNGTKPSDYTLVVDGLKRPRAIKIHKGYVYWTEWGEVAGRPTASVPRVSRMLLDGNNGKESLVTAAFGIKWANGIFIDDASSRLYVADGHPDSKMIYSCSLTGENLPLTCLPLTGLNGTLKHVYDIWGHDGIIYYTDWKSSAIFAFSEKNGKSWPVIQGLMRPSQMFIKFPVSPPEYCSRSNCTGACVPLVSGAGCTCNPGQILSFDDYKTCKNAAQECNVPGTSTTYRYGQPFIPANDVCVNCQCLAGSEKYKDPVYGQAKCNRITICPPLTCGGDGTTEKVPNQCCPKCKKECSVQITNCPTQKVRLLLPDDQSFAVHDYLPSVRDCRGLSREISFTKSPKGSLYEFTGKLETVTVQAETLENKESDTCEFTVEVIDRTPPRIQCPPDIVLYTSDTTANAKWNPPEVYDNVHYTYESSVKLGSPVPLGTTVVMFAVKDSSNNENSCSFSITVLKELLSHCTIPYVNNGRLNCTVISGSLSCNIQCNVNYVRSGVNQKLTCANGNWLPLDPNRDPNFEIRSCIKSVNKTANGNITVTSRNECGVNTILSYTENLMQDRIRTRYLWRSNFTLKSTTAASGCSVGDRNLYLTIVISGVYRDESEEKPILSDIDRILKMISDDLKTNFLLIGYLNQTGVHNVIHPEIQIHFATLGCLAGSKKLEDGSCGLCPTGTYELLRTTCQPCPKNTYNEKESQTICKHCPDGHVSDEGSQYRDQCLPPSPSDDFRFLIIIGAAIGGFIFVLLIVVILILISRLNKKKDLKEGKIVKYTVNDLHKNRGYDANDVVGDVYDKIEDESPSYERSSKERFENEYDNLNMEDCTKNPSSIEEKCYENPDKC